MKKLALLFAGMLASLLFASAQSYVRAGDGDYGKVLYSGENKYGKAVFTVQGSIPLAVLLWICVID